MRVPLPGHRFPVPMRSLLDIRPPERRGVIAAFATMAAAMAAHQLLETARDALFLASLPASRLPWVYLAIAVVGLALTRLPQSRVPRSGPLSGILLLSSAVTGGFWLLGSRADPATLYALYVWTALYATLVTIQFWLLLGSLYTVTQAKRVYGFIGTGGILGAITGAATARWLAEATDIRHGLLVAAAVMLVAAIGPPIMVRRCERAVRPEAVEASSPSLRGCIREIGAHPYTRRVAWLILVGAVVFTLLDYVFKSAVARAIPAAELGAFFASVSTGLNMLSLVVQLVLVRWVITRFGLTRALGMLPLLIFGGALGVAVGGGLLGALVMKSADGGLRHSLHRTATELLYVPMSEATRRAVKLFIDMVGQRGGQALASLGILAVVAVNGPAIAEIATACAAIALLWLILAVGLERHYLDLFRVTLEQQSVQTRIALPRLDLDSLEALLAKLNSPNDDEVVAVLELLAHQDRAHLIPDLILYHPSRRVVRCALEIIARPGRTSFLPITERLRVSRDPELRAAALRARLRVAPDPDELRAALSDVSPEVRAIAAIGLVEQQRDQDGSARAIVADLVHHGKTAQRLAVASTLRDHPSELLAELLVDLGRAPEREVRALAAEAMERRPDPAFVSTLVDMLEQRDLRAPARRALVAIGRPALDTLAAALVDTGASPSLRHHLPRTISRFEPGPAAAILVAQLGRERDGAVRFKILRGLGRIHADHPEVELDREVLHRALEQQLETAFRLSHWRQAVAGEAPGEDLELLEAVLHDKTHEVIERVMRLLGLLYADADFEDIHRGLYSHDRRAAASSRELLDGILDEPLRRAVLGLVEDPAPDPGEAGPYYRARTLTATEAMRQMLELGGDTVRSIAAHHVGASGLTALRPQLELQVQSASALVSEVARHALAALDGNGEDERAAR
jgi:ATP:ADP antiporter, AAA family